MKKTTQDEARATPSTHDELRPGEPRRRRLFVMRSGARLFAVYADEVEATSENLTPTPLLFAPAPVRGVVSQRGRILTVIDPLLLLPSDATPTNAPAAAPTPTPLSRQTSAPFIVALRGDEQLALSVERIEHGLEFFDDEADAGANAPGSLLVRRIIRHHTGDIALLDPAHLFDAAMQGVERRRRRT